LTDFEVNINLACQGFLLLLIQHYRFIFYY